jgi:hypothetical protein
MVFKVKERAAYNYFAKTATTQDDDDFDPKFILGTEGSKKSIPDYSYNWPFDFFSLIELAKIDAEVEMTPKNPIPSATGTENSNFSTSVYEDLNNTVADKMDTEKPGTGASAPKEFAPPPGSVNIPLPPGSGGKY